MSNDEVESFLILNSSWKIPEENKFETKLIKNYQICSTKNFPKGFEVYFHHFEQKQPTYFYLTQKDL
jgi:hypothetical protein